jgi:transposase
MENELLKSFSFSNSNDGFNLLDKKIKSYKKRHHLCDVFIGMESTNNYWYPLAYFIENHTSYHLLQVNCKHTKRFKDVTDNSSNKTDFKDPKVIAQIVLIGSGLRVNLPEGDKALVRELTRTRSALMEDKKRVINRIHSLLAKYFPELLRSFKDISCKTCIFLLQNYPCPAMIASMDLKQLEKQLKKISRGRFTHEKVLELQRSSQNSIGVLSGNEGYQATISLYLQQLVLLQEQIAQAEKVIEEKVTSIDEYKILNTIRGLGTLTIATIISEIGNFDNFKTQKEIIKYAGINLVENSSGNHKGEKRISKIGNKKLRTALYFGTLRMIKKDGIYYDLYQYHLKKGMKKKKAIMAISRKLLRTILAMVNNNKSYKTDYEIKQYSNAA